MEKQKQIDYVVSELKRVYAEREEVHNHFFKSGLHKDKVTHEALCNELRALALQYTVLCLDLGKE